MQGSEEIAWMGLECHHAAGHAPVLRLVLQQGEHGLVATVHAIEVADGQSAAGRRAATQGLLQVPETSDDFHG